MNAARTRLLKSGAIKPAAVKSAPIGRFGNDVQQARVRKAMAILSATLMV